MSDYEMNDQRDKLGEPPWSGPELEAWEEAHGHDARSKCYPEYGCQLNTYERGVEATCARLGHRHLLGDDTCLCGKVPAHAPSGAEVRKVLDRYHDLAADALCREKDHQSPQGMAGLTGFSWRDGSCCCDYDVYAVLSALGEVAAHVQCREVLDGIERVNAALRGDA